MKGLKIVKNTMGSSIKAIIDLDLHGKRWQNIYNDVLNDSKEQEPIRGIRYEQKENIVELDLPLHEDILEDFYDGVLIDEQKDEAPIPWDEVKLKIVGKRTSKKTVEH